MSRFSFLLVALISMLPLAHAAEDYILGAGDTVRITVYGHPDLSTDARLSGSGTISFPLLGEVLLNGMTERQAEASIADLLEKGSIVKSPQVSVAVQQYESQQVAVLGKVNKPGKYSIDRGQTVLDLIAMAGGVASDGDDNTILVKSTKDAKAAEKVVNLNGLIRGGDTPQSMQVSDGDIIYIPRTEMFYIYGQVRRPGSYRLEHSMTVMQALSVAEGLTDKGTERGLRIHRRDDNGKTQTLNAQLTDELKPNDVIYVRESLF